MRPKADTHYPNGSIWWTARMGGGKITIEQVEIARHVNIEGSFSHFDAYTVPSKSLRQIFNTKCLFKTKEELCNHYIKQLKDEKE